MVVVKRMEPAGDFYVNPRKEVHPKEKQFSKRKEMGEIQKFIVRLSAPYAVVS